MVAGAALLAEALWQGRTLRSPKTGESYALQRQVGEGAHGQVWLALDSSGDERALKVVLPEAHDPRQAELIAAEISKAQAASEFVRELVPRFDEAFSLDCKGKSTGQAIGLLVIVMEYVDGYSVDAMVQRQTLPEGHASVILRSLCLALERLHGRGTIHRDVKGANVMVASSGRVYLCDFGVSRWLQTAADRARTVAGTPYWMAPEVVLGAQSGSANGYGCEADVWSVGITAIELVEGAAPLARNVYCRANPYHVFHLVTQEKAPRLDTSHSPALRKFVAQCLVKDPAKRATVRDLLEDPNGFLQPFTNGQQMLRDLVAFMRAEEAELARSGCGPCPPSSYGRQAAQSAEAGPAVEEAPGLATLTFQELRVGVAVAQASCALAAESLCASASSEPPPAELTLGPVVRRPLQAVAVQAPGARLPGHCAPTPPRAPGPQEERHRVPMGRPCPSSPPATPPVKLQPATTLR